MSLKFGAFTMFVKKTEMSLKLFHSLQSRSLYILADIYCILRQNNVELRKQENLDGPYIYMSGKYQRFQN